eukprot:UN00619
MEYLYCFPKYCFTIKGSLQENTYFVENLKSRIDNFENLSENNTKFDLRVLKFKILHIAAKKSGNFQVVLL